MANPVEIVANQYETVAASQTSQIMGTAGAKGDYIEGLLVVPASTSPGAVTLIDGTTSITVFAGGASSLTTLIPFYIPLGINSVGANGWSITTGASLSLIAMGKFS